MNNLGKNLVIWATIIIMMVVLFNLFNQTQRQEAMPYTEFLELVSQGQVEKVRIQGQQLTGILSGNRPFTTYAPNDPTLIQKLVDNNVQVNAEPMEEAWYIQVLISWFPMLLLIGVWIFFMRQMQGGGGKAMSFGKSR
ncbi:MAG: ATP-dependent metallopeptidase FtsH/Yme1/Tma family protein, partial [Proteobacteria bacterium]|nr:ATP-dependent metallopeptidase FtsH/Yme1/Tma family protein [Pseudomonadota bacterium]